MRIPNNAEIFQYFWLFWGKTKMFTFPKFRRPPTTRIYCCPVLSWWAEDYTDKWPNMARRNSESGPRAELWRFRLFGIESRLEPEGKVRISNEPPGVVKTILTNDVRKENIHSREIVLVILCGKTNLDFSCMFFESRPLRYNFTPYQGFTIWNVFYHPYLHIYPPTQAAIPHIAHGHRVFT